MMGGVNEDLDVLKRPEPVLLGGYNSDSSDCSIEEFYVIDYNFEGKGKGQRRYLRSISPLPAAMKVPDFLPSIEISNRITDTALPKISCSQHKAPSVNVTARGNHRVHSIAKGQRKIVSKSSENTLKPVPSESSHTKAFRSKTEYHLKETPHGVSVIMQERSCPSISSENVDHSQPRTKRKIKRPETFTITRSGRGDG